MGEIEPEPSPALTPPPGNPRFPLLDGLRGINVLAVLLFHASELTGTVGFGVLGRFCEVAANQGVLTFFAISGFLLYRPYVAARAGHRSAPRPLTYARRRLLRVAPAYWIALTLLGIFPGLAGVFSGEWWRYYGYLQIYASRTNDLGLQVAWTLCIEVSFYVLLPVWAAAIARVGRRAGLLGVEAPALALVGAGGIAVQCLSNAHHINRLLASTLAGDCTWLALGMALAVLSVRGAGRRHGLTYLPECAWGLAAGAYAGLMALVPAHGLFGLILATRTPTSSWLTLARAALEAVMVTGLIVPAVLPGRRSGVPARVLAFRPLAALGVISYSFYLWHLPIAEVIWVRSTFAFSAHGWDLSAHIHSARTSVLFLISLAATLVIATASYRLIERPFLLRKEPGSSRPRAPHMLRGR